MNPDVNNQPSPQPISTASDKARFIQNLIISGLAICLTVFIGTLCIFALASTLTQSRILSLSFDGVPANIWKLDSVRADWSDLRGQASDQALAIRLTTREKVETESKLTKASEEANAAKRQIERVGAELSANLVNRNDELANFLNSDVDWDTKIAKIRAAEPALRISPAGEPTRPDLGPALDRFDKASTALTSTVNAYNALDAESRGLDQKLKSLANGAAAIQDSFEVVFLKITKTADAPTRARIENALYELDPSTRIFNRAIYHFITLQPDVLSLLLVVLMGVLGSSMQILHSLFRDQRVGSFGDYILRISVGAITALVIFIVAKAGVPIIADASRLSGDAPINPYFVSFVAIISGLLSEQAIITVQNQGQRFFATGSDEPDRWARHDLQPDMTAQQLTVDGLARYLNTPNETAAAIVKGEQKATGDQQKTIAIYLRKSIRELFSDIPPA